MMTIDKASITKWMSKDQTIEWFENKHWLVQALFVCFGSFTCFTALLAMIPTANPMWTFIFMNYSYFSIAGFIVSAPIFQHYQKPVKNIKSKH